MKVGDLIKWTDYKDSVLHPVEYIGLVVMDLKESWTKKGQIVGSDTWHDLLVLCQGDYVYWTSWQCEVINEKE